MAKISMDEFNAQMNAPVALADLDARTAELLPNVDQRDRTFEFCPYNDHGVNWNTPHNGHVRGVAYGTVPFILDAEKDITGAWLISCTGSVRQYQGYSLTRFAPMPESMSDDFSFAFSRGRAGFAHEMLKAMGFPDGEVSGRLSVVEIQARSNSYFRLDKMLVAACILNDAANESDRAVEFRAKLEALGLGFREFLDELGGSCFGDGSANVLRERSRPYRNLVGLVCDEAIPDWRKVRTGADWNRVNRAFNLGSPIEGEYLNPIVHTFYMPKWAFDSIDEVFEAGWPPIVPNWFTANTYQFHGPGSGSCGGDVTIEQRVETNYELKLLQSVSGPFLDHEPCIASLWKYNVPDGWREAFVAANKNIVNRQSHIPDMRMQADVVLTEARQLPIIIVDKESVNHYFRFKRYERNGRRVSAVEMEACNPAGRPLEG